MTAPTPVASPEELCDCVVSRRFMVEQIKEKHDQQVQAFRQIDHLTESGINPATVIQETLENDTLDLFFNIISVLLSRRTAFSMFKEDISRAFRRLPIKVQHLKFMVVLFMYQGTTWRAQHLTCLFGAVGSVTAWHRVSSLLKNVMIRCTRSILGRYVDDFFGVDLPNLYWTTPKMFTALCSLVGAPCDPGKAAYEMTQMAILGALILIDFGN